MEGTPISSCFYVMNAGAQMQGYQEAIERLQADEKANSSHVQSDEEQISYYQQLEENLKQLEAAAAAYRQSDNDPTISQQIGILLGRDQTLNQLLQLDASIQKLKDDMKKNPQNTQEDLALIANEEQQKQAIQAFQSAWEAYKQSGSASDAETLNAIIQELQELRSQDPQGPLSKGPIFEDFQQVVSAYTVFSFDGQRYAVSPF